jgi:hypothetical protein
MTTSLPITGSTGRTYRLTLIDGVAVGCTCRGWQYRGACRHITEHNRARVGCGNDHPSVDCVTERCVRCGVRVATTGAAA